ncbi:MAG: FAD-dependent oxidoreductase, partial [Mycetocola sp.]
MSTASTTTPTASGAPLTTTDYDLVVIGAGPVGENVADRAVQGGLRVALVESELVGGECSYWACMPSKALLRSGQALRAAQRVPGAAQAVTGDLDVAAVLARRTEYTSNWSDAGQVSWVEGAGITLIRGHARLVGEREVAVTTPAGSVVTLRARQAVAIATGSGALIPDIPGLRECAPWTNREATAVQTPPRSLVIVGGGVVAVEMATAFTDLGSTVTVVARGSLL